MFNKYEVHIDIDDKCYVNSHTNLFSMLVILVRMWMCGIGSISIDLESNTKKKDDSESNDGQI